MRKMIEKKGITLIALVITIIVLLILAGITINLTIGQDGIITKAQQAEKKTQEGEEIDKQILADHENKIGEYVSSAREQVMVDKEEYENLKANSRTIVKIESTTPSSINAWNKLCDYPEGYDMNNTKIYTYIILFNNEWYTNEARMGWSMRNDGIYMYTDDVNMTSKTIKLYLVNLD